METKTRRSRRQAGVTLIEMMVVVTIIALFVALVAPKLFKQADKAKITAARAQMNNFMTALGAYKLDTSTFPTTEQGLAALRIRPANMPLWNGPYLPQDVPLDPWGRAYVYRYPGESGDEPEIVSLGADGQPGGEGIDADVLSWRSQ
jgi:general secretion pathway protein G